MRTTTLMTVMLLSCAAIGCAEGTAASWLDEQKPRSWNTPGLAIPGAPNVDGAVDARCRAQARPPQLAEDARVRQRGWELVGAYQAGWQVLIIAATASYDGMCRPKQFQYFVFVRGVFAGTLSPQPMDSRTDGALSRVLIQDATQVTAEYLRYEPSDPLCCASRTTRVVFEIEAGKPAVRPVSASTSRRR
jgi:hypothetical protein